MVTGDFDPAAAMAKLAATFGAAPAGTAFEWAAAPASVGRSPDAVDRQARCHPDLFSDRAARHRQEEPRPRHARGRQHSVRRTFTSLLNDALRVNSGLTYGASAQLQEDRLPGAIVISTYTKTDTTTQAIDMALDVLKRFSEKGITAEQLASAKAYVKGLYPTRRLETIGDSVDGYFSRIDAITLERANAVIAKYYHPDNLTFAILGVAGKIRESVKKYNPQFTELSIKDAGWGAY